MTIIRNDRRQREARELEAAASRDASEGEESVDLRWHPTEEELPEPISCERWEALLKDPTVFDEDGMHAVECLDSYGGPATLQQLSVRYRGTMGRYRKWLNGVAERAAKHEGRPSLGTDQFGREEWWPYLYRQRIVGKAAANVYEMLLQPELQEALRKREEAKSAERKRQLEAEAEATRARNAEQRRARLEAAAKAQEEAKAQAAAREAAEQRRSQTASRAQAASRPVSATVTTQASSRPAASTAQATVSAASPGRGGVVLDLPETAQPKDDASAAPVASAAPAEASAPVAASPASDSADLAADDALVAFLTTMEGIGRGGAAKRTKARGGSGARSSQGKQASWRPLDYAHRYADRLADALELMADGLPELTVARVARELGDESVEELAGYLNGTSTPSFAYLKRLCDLLLVDEHRLEAPDSRAADLPVFCTLRERFGAAGAARRVWDGAREVVFVTDDSRDRRSGVIVRFSELSCGLLERTPVPADADRYSDPALSAYVRLVREIDSRAEAGSLTRSVRKVSAKEWDALATGLVWPGLFC